MFATVLGNIIERRPLAGSSGSGFAGLAGTYGAFVLIIPFPKKLKISFAGGRGPAGGGTVRNASVGGGPDGGM